MLCLDLNFPFLLIIITAMDGLLVTIKLFPLNFCNESCVGTDGPFAQLSSANMIPSEGLLLMGFRNRIIILHWNLQFVKLKNFQQKQKEAQNHGSLLRLS